MIPLDQVRTLPCCNRAEIPPEYLDMMGHMNVQWYLALYSVAARKILAAAGMNEEYYTRSRCGTFALRQYVQYLAEVHVGHTVSVHVRLLGRSPKRLHFIEFMVNETTGMLSSTMEVLCAHADLQARRTTPFPERLAARLDEMIGEHSMLDWAPPLCGIIRP